MMSRVGDVPRPKVALTSLGDLTGRHRVSVASAGKVCVGMNNMMNHLLFLSKTC